MIVNPLGEMLERRRGETPLAGRNTCGRQYTPRVRAVASLSTACALILVAACGATQTDNRGAGATAAPQQTAAPTAAPAQEPVREGEITITPITHASLQIEYGGRVIHVDPTSPGDYSRAKQADLSCGST